MPPSQMELDTQEMEVTGRKRTHTEFAGDLEKADSDAGMKASDPALPAISQHLTRSPPDGSPALTDAARSTPALGLRSPQTPSKTTTPKPLKDDQRSISPDAAASQTTTSTDKPAIKRKRLTPQEKEARDRDLAEKKKEREAQAALRAAEKAIQEEDKAARAKEREEKRKKKEEEQRRIQDEKDKKARSQTKLGFFFNVPKTPTKTAARPGSKDASPAKSESGEATSKPVLSAYDQLFKPFFVRENTRWTSATAHMNEETRRVKSQALDDFISGRRAPADEPAHFDAAELFGLPRNLPKRGRLHHPVQHIMESAFKETQKSGGSSQMAASRIQQIRDRLAKVPMKIIAFSQDVRLPYYGTITNKPFALGKGNMYRLARKTTDRRLPLNYDYDSEAEWQEEEGEDVDVDDDDEEQDDEDDMDGFLDDSEDAGLSRRVFANTMEPESSGICFENSAGRSTSQTLSGFKMQIMHEGIQNTWGIDPWSTQYWEPEEKRKPTKTANTAGGAAKMAPPKAPANALEAIGDNAEKAGSRLVKAELLNDVKRIILEYRDLSKVGIIDVILHEFRKTRSSVSRAEVKFTLDTVAVKKGVGRSGKWDLRPGHEIKL